jgi:hypothetical protein
MSGNPCWIQSRTSALRQKVDQNGQRDCKRWRMPPGVDPVPVGSYGRASKVSPPSGPPGGSVRSGRVRRAAACGAPLETAAGSATLSVGRVAGGAGAAGAGGACTGYGDARRGTVGVRRPKTDARRREARCHYAALRADLRRGRRRARCCGRRGRGGGRVRARRAGGRDLRPNACRRGRVSQEGARSTRGRHAAAAAGDVPVCGLTGPGPPAAEVDERENASKSPD